MAGTGNRTNGWRGGAGTDGLSDQQFTSPEQRGIVIASTLEPLVSVVLPCLDEEEAIGSCIEKIQGAFASAGIVGEIVVCDNGSTDRSVSIAEQLGARVVHQPLRGYGNAYLKGFA